MAKKIAIGLKLNQPDNCDQCMCVYKFTLNTGFYYYGATSNLLDRIHTHLKKYRNNKMPTVLYSATTITFEIVKYANNRKKLKEYEEYYLERNVGLPLCLNKEIYSTSSYQRHKSIYPIVKMDLHGNILKRYDCPAMAAIDLGKPLQLIRNALLITYPKTPYILRRLDENGNIIKPFKPFREVPSQRKPIIQYDKEMELVAKFASSEDASRHTGFDRKGISSVAKGRQKYCHGFIFKYA